MGMVCAHLHQYTYPHMSAPGLPTLGFLGSRCKAIHADTSTTYPVTACLCAIPASKWCLYHPGLPWYTCVTCPQSLEAPECPEPSSRWQETLPGPASSLGPQNDPPSSSLTRPCLQGHSVRLMSWSPWMQTEHTEASGASQLGHSSSTGPQPPSLYPVMP